MKTLYIECNMGAAGDMLMAALLDLVPNPDAFLNTMKSLGIPGVEIKRSDVVKCGIRGTGISVAIHGEEEKPGQALIENAGPHTHIRDHGHDHHDLDGDHPHTHDRPHKFEKEDGHKHEHSHEHGEENGHHHHAGLRDIKTLIAILPVSEKVKQDALAVYGLIAEAESRAHGVSVEEIHFHEVGQLDAVTDIVGVCVLMELLSPERILVSPIHVGSGQVKTAHGILPVPAPATAHILRDVPIYSRGIRGELCTPTGAALLKHFAQEFSEMPLICVEKIGYGMGKKDFEAANCVRAIFGESDAAFAPNDKIAELSCNLDDMTPEAIGYALEALLQCGALDAFVTPIQMKKNRPAQMLTCLCQVNHAAEIAQLMLKYTTTIGVRQTTCRRYILQSRWEQVETAFGPIRVKISSGYGIEKCKPEYEDVAQRAKEHGAAFEQVYRAVLLAKPEA